jgi:ribonuclease T2
MRSTLRVPGAIAVACLALLCLASAPVNARHRSSANSEGGPGGVFDYYLLALSWAPSYCLVHPADRAECGGRGYAFVLHGLWPQFEAGGFPEHCSSDATLDAAAAALGQTLYPSARLMQHEWDTHGTCSGLSASDYFHTADRALAVVKVPAVLEAPATAQTLSAAQISAAFLAANAGLAGEDLIVACSRGTLSEVRVCLTRDLKVRACGRRVHSSCGEGPVQVPSAR